MEINNFDKQKSNVVKGAAILLLLFHHLFYDNSRLIDNGINIVFYNKLYHVVNMSRICVWIFVFISAYGLTVKYAKYSVNNDNGKFILQSWLKLMGQWWIIFILKIVITELFVSNIFSYYRYDPLKFFLDLMEWNDFFGIERILGNWYMCFAQLLILFIPILNWAIRKFGISFIIVFFVMMQYMSGGITSNGGGEYIIYIPVALIGVWFAQDSNRIEMLIKMPLSKCMKILDAGGTLVITGITLWLKWKYNVMYMGSLYVVIATISIVAFCIKYLKALHKPLEFLGRHSAAMFLIHVYLLTEFSSIVYFTGNAILSYIILIVLSLLFAFLVEVIKCCIKLFNNM